LQPIQFPRTACVAPASRQAQTFGVDAWAAGAAPSPIARSRQDPRAQTPFRVEAGREARPNPPRRTPCLQDAESSAIPARPGSDALHPSPPKRAARIQGERRVPALPDP
ncbi:MAG: hypothetical protein ACK56I_07230, partial [bacterium]